MDKAGIDGQRGRSDGGLRRWSPQLRKWKRLYGVSVEFVQIFDVPAGKGSRAYAETLEKAVADILRDVIDKTGSNHLKDRNIHKCP